VSAPYLHFAPDVPGLTALGAASFADLMGDAEGLRGLESVEPGKPQVAGCATFRYPLPGTPDASGRLTGRPCGAGTGWVRLRRFEGAGLRETLNARLGTPRSLSLAEREWNLICHLRANGVGAPDPMAVGREGGGVFAKRSFLVTRELDGFRPLSELASEETGARARRSIARAVGQCLARLFRSGVHLPELDAEHILISRVPVRGERSESVGLAYGRLPEVVLTGLGHGRIGREPTADERERLLERIRAGVPESSRRELLRAGLPSARALILAGRWSS
jgi:hypothetical protein